MKKTLIDLVSASIWKPIAKNLMVAAVGAATAYVIDRWAFDAELAHGLANEIIRIGIQFLG